MLRCSMQSWIRVIRRKSDFTALTVYVVFSNHTHTTAYNSCNILSEPVTPCDNQMIDEVELIKLAM